MFRSSHFLQEKSFLNLLNIKRLCSNNKYIYTYPSEKIILYQNPKNYDYCAYYPSEKNIFQTNICYEHYKSASFIPLLQLISNIDTNSTTLDK
jgi:hypothetical protein